MVGLISLWNSSCMGFDVVAMLLVEALVWLCLCCNLQEFWLCL